MQSLLSRFLCLLGLVGLILFLSPAKTFANSPVIQGYVTSPTGAPIPNAQVVWTDIQHGCGNWVEGIDSDGNYYRYCTDTTDNPASRQTYTDANGFYSFAPQEGFGCLEDSHYLQAYYPGATCTGTGFAIPQNGGPPQSYNLTCSGPSLSPPTGTISPNTSINLGNSVNLSATGNATYPASANSAIYVVKDDGSRIASCPTNDFAGNNCRLTTSWSSSFSSSWTPAEVGTYYAFVGVDDTMGQHCSGNPKASLPGTYGGIYFSACDQANHNNGNHNDYVTITVNSVPICNGGPQCSTSACSASVATACGSATGTQTTTCTYTTYNGSNNCTQTTTTTSNSCTVSKTCSPGLACIGGSCLPDCDATPVCSGVCSANVSTACGSATGTQSGCVYTTKSGYGSCKQVTAPNQTCTDSKTCKVGYTCMPDGSCATPPSTPQPYYLQACMNANSYNDGTPLVKMFWNEGSPISSWVDISDDQSFPNGNVYHAAISSNPCSLVPGYGNKCIDVVPNAFNGYNGTSGSLTVQANKKYYVRVYNGLHSGIGEFKLSKCLTAQCIPVSSTFNNATNKFDLTWRASVSGGDYTDHPTITYTWSATGQPNQTNTSSNSSIGTNQSVTFSYPVSQTGLKSATVSISDGQLSISNLSCSSQYVSYSPWLQTSTGDVHSNSQINTPGGP